MSEAAFQEAVLEYARLRGWLVYHTYDSRRCTPGFPDLVLVRVPQVLFVELKTERGRISSEQYQWIAALTASNQATFLWRPGDWPAIERILR